jgi:hypothetical protein
MLRKQGSVPNGTKIRYILDTYVDVDLDVVLDLDAAWTGMIF